MDATVEHGAEALDRGHRARGHPDDAEGAGLAPLPAEHRAHEAAQRHDLDAVTKALTAFGSHVTAATLGWKAKHPVALDDAARAEVEAWLAEIDADADVQNLYVGLE